MIKTNELRIGNYLCDDKDMLCKVESINLKWFRAPAIKGAITRLPIKPIPLTKEWLIKLGFHEMISQEGYFIKSLTLDDKMTLESEDFIFHLPSGKICVDIGMFVHTIGIVILNVHELQNVFFALTGEELTIK